MQDSSAQEMTRAMPRAAQRPRRWLVMVPKLEEFLARLEVSRIHFRLARTRAGYVMVQIAVPGERWEVEFGEEGQVEVEIFKSDGTVAGSEALADLFKRFDDAS